MRTGAATIGTEEVAQCARLLRILAHPTRLMILAELLEAEKCVGDIQDLLAVPQPNVSPGIIHQPSGAYGRRRMGKASRQNGRRSGA